METRFLGSPLLRALGGVTRSQSWRLAIDIDFQESPTSDNYRCTILDDFRR
ncbi:hypothetical protein GCM10010246_85090 [Streptomyces cuspidosporus]|uniref:Transposase n=1 Tax=Streptomyces cuspidosporus TaxID=66882 RepID=A0ABP5UEU5_9ACTN